MVGKHDVKAYIKSDKEQTGYPQVANIINKRPGRVTVNKLGLGLGFKVTVRQVYVFSLDHQPPHILNKMRRMRVFLGVAIGMVHTVDNSVSTRI